MFSLLPQLIRSLLGVGERELTEHTPLAKTEADILDAVKAIHRATDSIEHHVEVIEGLATSVGPLTDAVDHLTATMADLVVLLAPFGSAERGVQRVEHFFGRHGHDPKTAPARTDPAAD